MLTSGCPSDFHHVQTTALHAHIQWSTACTHLVVHRMHTSSGPPDAAHPVVHRMRHIRWTTSGTFPDAWGCDIRWSTGGQPVDHRMWHPVVHWWATSGPPDVKVACEHLVQCWRERERRVSLIYTSVGLIYFLITCNYIWLLLLKWLLNLLKCVIRHIRKDKKFVYVVYELD